VSIPVDDWEREAEMVTHRTVSRLRFPDPSFIDTFAARLNRSTRPVFVVGPGVDRNGAWEQVVALAERYQALVWVSPMSPRSSFPERHPLFAGFLPAIRERIVERLTGHDVVLALGAPVFTYHIEGFGPHVPPGAELLQMVDDPDVAARTPGGTIVVCDVRLGAEALLQRPAPSSRPAPQGRCAPARVEPGAGISPAFLMQTIADVRPPDSILVEESPSTRSTMQIHLPIERPRSFFTCASGGLGHSLPAGVGVALATGSSRRVIGLFGDGSSMYSIQALWSAADLKLPMTIIIVNNGGYAALSEFLSHFNLKEPIGTEVRGIDFAGLARSLGCAGVRVDKPGELAATLRDAFQSPVPILVDVAVA
jgi:benzoylformate decarboxylase